MKRVPERGGSPSDSGDEESASSDNETMALVKAHKNERKAAKEQRKRGRDGPPDEEANKDFEPDEPDEGSLFLFDKRSGVDGSVRVMGVDGEEDLEDDVEADLGMKVEPFNLRAEMAVGHFTEEGHYVERNFGSTRDAWLDEMDEEEQARKPRSAADRKKKVVRVAADANAAAVPDKATSAGELASMIKELHGLLQDGNETVTGALSRLARDKRAAHEQRKNESRKKHAATVVDQSTREFKVRIFRVRAAKPCAKLTQLCARNLWPTCPPAALARPKSHLIVPPCWRIACCTRARTTSTRCARKTSWCGLAADMCAARLTLTLSQNVINAKKRTAKIWHYIIRGGGADGTDSDVFGPFSTDQMLEWSEFLSQQPSVDVKLAIGKQRQWRPFKSVNLEQDIAELN